MIEEQDKEVIEAIITKAINGKFDRLANRLLSTFAIIVTVFLFVIGGSYAFTITVDEAVNRVEERAETNKDELEATYRDLGTISSVMADEYPDSPVIQDMHERYGRVRGPNKKN